MSYKDRFRVVLDNISDGVISIDRDGKITTINKVAAGVYNREPETIIGQNIQNLDRSQYAILDCLGGKSLKNEMKKYKIQKVSRIRVGH